jgi:hypothetical protein
MKYLVEIIPESITDMAAATSKLAATLKLEPAKAAALLRRNPVTKPISQAEADKVAKLFSKAGIEVYVRSEEELTEVAPVVIPARADTLIRQIHETEQATPGEPGAESIQHHESVTTPQNLVTPQNLAPPRDIPGLGPSSTAVPSELSQAQTQQHIEPQFTEPEFTEPEFTEPGLDAPVTEKAPSLAPETQQVSSATNQPDPFQAKSIQGEETPKIPPSFFTPVPEGSLTSHSEQSSPELPVIEEMMPPRAQSGLGKIAFASILPGLLALAGVLTALYLLGLPFLQGQQRVSAETTAVSLANSIGGWIGDVSLDNPALSQQVQSVIARTQSDLRGRGIDFVLLTDTEGNQLAGWYKDSPGVPDTIAATETLKTQISNAMGAAVAASTNARLTLDGETLGLASAAVRRGDTPVGAVVVGTSEQQLMTKVRPLLTPLLLAGLLPLLLGILLSLLLGRNRS